MIRQVNTFKILNNFGIDDPVQILYIDKDGVFKDDIVSFIDSITFLAVEDTVSVNTITSTQFTIIDLGPTGLTWDDGEEEIFLDPILIDFLVGNVSVSGGTDGFVTINISGGSGNFNFHWSNGASTKDISGVAAGVYTFFGTDNVTGITKSITSQVTQPEPLTASRSVSNCTSVGSNDGSITLTVNGGSGNYSFAWGDGPTVQNRSGLAPGTYSVVVTDLITAESVTIILITITEPSIEIPPVNPRIGTVLRVPFLNSLQFVVRGSSTPQGIDNVLFCEQVFKNFTDSTYFQKIHKDDSHVLQFNSDFDNHTLQLLDVKTDEIIKTFSINLKEQNIGNVDDFNIRIQNDTTTGKSRVYFQVGTPPLLIAPGDIFEILNNADGFNGTFSIVEIITDNILGYQYMVINRNYDISSTSSNATGRFRNDTEDFNVYESSLTFLDVANGFYYLKLTAFSDNEMIAESEPIDLRVEHEGTNLITYRNTDNAFDITWTTGYIGRIRVESLFGHKRLPGGERTTSRNSDFSMVKVSARKQRVFLFETFWLPPWLHEKLSVIFDCDLFQINSIPCQSSEGYAEPDYLDRFLLSNSSIKVEQVGWFDQYNSDDIGSVNEQGFIIANQGLLKR